MSHLIFRAPLDSDRPFFELVRDATARGEFDGTETVWVAAHKLGDQAPQWGCELLHAYLAERPGALTVIESHGVTDLHADDYGALELIWRCADGAPERFLQLLLPYMLAVMAATELETTERPREDVHFSNRIWRSDVVRADDALLAGAAHALRELAADDPPALDQFTAMLAADPHDGAQWLLYEALKAAGDSHAQRAADILLEGEHRLLCGYSDSPFWTTRELLQAIGPHVSDESFALIEHAAISLAPAWEKNGRGLASFTLLSALDERRLSDAGRRRIGELRRRFGAHQPAEPFEIQADFVKPPIPQDAAEKMTDAQWLSAIDKHSDEERPPGADFLRGGARELANVLAEETKADPDRFARLALRIDANKNPSYIEAILRGLGELREPVTPEEVFATVRHAAGLRHERLDRWIGWPLRRLLEVDIPDDVLELILDRALNSPDPSRESWLEEAPSGGVYYGGDPAFFGINTGRGSAAQALGDLLVRDTDGTARASSSHRCPASQQIRASLFAPASRM